MGQGECIASLLLVLILRWFELTVGCGFNASRKNSGYLSFHDRFPHPYLLEHSTHLYFNATIPALTVTLVKDVQQRI